MKDATQMRNLTARRVALAELQRYKAKPTGMIQYQSRGRLVVIGNEEAVAFVSRLNDKLQPLVLLTKGEVQSSFPTIPLNGRVLIIEGFLGSFKIYLGEKGSPDAESLTADLILDLNMPPLLNMPMKPPGYVASALDNVNLRKAADELAGLTGVFEKPVYFDYNASICAHGRAGITACTRCIDTCPAEAIMSLTNSIEVNSKLCQGGGICATVCPSGAIRYAYPEAGDSLVAIRTLLHVYGEQGGKDPVLVFCVEARDLSPELMHSNLLTMVVEELASVGLEMWLSTLAYGAGSVLLLNQGALPPAVAESLQAQLRVAGEILKALGYPENAIRMVTPHSLSSNIDSPVMPPIRPASFYATGGKRQILYKAIDHLFDQAQHSKLMADLSTGAPFGTAYVEQASCTLCFACVNVCPAKALQTGDGKPELQFIEANCLQCGLCTRTCPEDAIWITPRLLFDNTARTQVRVLKQEPPFCCICCGKPFATRSVINNMLIKLQNHWMFQSERARNRLKMCETCRTVDALEDPEAMELVKDRDL